MTMYTNNNSMSPTNYQYDMTTPRSFDSATTMSMSTHSSFTDSSNPEYSSAFAYPPAVDEDSMAPIVKTSTLSKNKPENRPETVLKMRDRRRVRTVAAGVAGGVVGLLVLGPLGAVFGGTGAAVATKKLGKRAEYRKQEEIGMKKIRQQEKAAGRPLAAHAGTVA